MLIYELIKQDHDKVKGLLNDLLLVSEKDDLRSRLIDQIRDEIIPHSRAEESVFYNSLRALDVSKDIVMHGYGEHVEIETLLRTLQLKDIVDANWRKTAIKLRETLIHHIDEEEDKIFTVAKKVFTRDEAVMMGYAFEELKPEVRGENFVQTTFDLVINLMPPRFVPQQQHFNPERRP